MSVRCVCVCVFVCVCGWMDGWMIETHLATNQQIEALLRYEERGSGPVGIRDGGADVLIIQTLKGVQRLQASPEHIIEDETDASPPVQLTHFNRFAAHVALAGNRVTELGSEVTQHAQQHGSLLVAVQAVRRIAKTVHLTLRVDQHLVNARLVDCGLS